MRKFLSCRQNFLILMAISVSILFIRSPNHGDNDFDTLTYYKSFSSPIECFHIFNNNPSGPRFLLTHIEYKLYSSSSKKKNKVVSKNYQLKRIPHPCNNSITLPNLQGNYSKMDLKIFFYLYYDEEYMAKAVYNIAEGFDPLSLIIVTDDNNFGLKVEFSDSANENSTTYIRNLLDVYSYLLSKDISDNSVCIITKYNRQLVFLPESEFYTEPWLIRIRIKYNLHERDYFVEDYPAFWCPRADDMTNEIIYLIHEEDLKIRIFFIYFKEYILNPLKIDKPIKFSNIKTLRLDDMKKYPHDIKKIFVIKTRKKTYKCPKDMNIILFMSEGKIPYRAIYNEIIDVAKGVKRHKIFPHQPSELCK